MPAELIDGKALAQEVRQQVAAEVAELTSDTGIVPGLTVILVGEDPASQVYVSSKQKASSAAGMNGTILRLPAETSQAELLATIDRLNDDPARTWNPRPDAPPEAHRRAGGDPAGEPSERCGRISSDQLWAPGQGTPRFIPCTPLGIRELLLHAKVETRGTHAVVLGRSQLVGKPMALLLLQKGLGGDATVTVCHTATRDPASIARQADILVVAMGRPEQVTADWVKPGAVVIDVGIHKRADGRLCGDVHFPSVAEVASRITPVPGGVGPMTVAMLLRNTLMAARASLSSPTEARPS